MTDWKRVIKSNYAQMGFVFLAFTLMVLIGCFSVGNSVQKSISSTVNVALDESEKTIRAYLREPKIAFDNIYMAVTTMLDRGESQEDICLYLTQTTDSLRNQTDGVLGFTGVYGFIREEFIDSIGLNPGADFIPQQRPWYQLAVRNDKAEYTAPYVDQLTENVVISLAQELYGANGDYYGVLSLDVDITWMMEYVQSLQFVEGGYGLIVNQYIYTVAHPMEELRNIPLQELGPDYVEVTDMLRKDQEISALRLRDTNGKSAIVYFRRLYNDWSIGVVMPVGSYYADLYFTAFMLITTGSVLMLALNIILLRLSAAKLRSDEENKAKSSFLARMSHEIRTPMNAILGMVELLLRKDLPQEAREDAAAIKHAGTNLLSIINDILDFSKIESNHMEITQSTYYLSSLINDVVNIIQVRATEASLELRLNIDETLPGILEGDEVRLRQILLNLLSNGVKYTREGWVSLSVSGEVKGNNTLMLSFEVADSGIGIKDEDLDKLFGDFTQVDLHKNIGVEGTGLGLAIARNLCRLMGGEISVSSVYGKGSVFLATLPQKIIGHEPLAGAISYNEPEEFSLRFKAPAAKALIVDDIVTNLKVAEGLMAPYEMTIECCDSGHDAIRLIQQHEYDIVFMDHMMPEMDGIEAVKIIRGMRDPRFHTLPLIALTANAVSGMREMFIQAGFNDYLAKPIDMAKLNVILEKWLPAQKQERLDGEAGPQMAAEDMPAIDGLDTKRGMMMTGGSKARYREVLSLFCRDAAARLEILQKTPDQDNLKLFVTQVHALKSAAASIGAAALSELAAALEKAGRDGDIAAIQERQGRFFEQLTALTARIEAALSNDEANSAKEEGLLDTLDAKALSELKEALEIEDIGAIDSILDSLMQGAYNEDIRNRLEAIEESILLSEFADATQLIDELLQR